jgi:uncharacterized membrane protein
LSDAPEFINPNLHVVLVHYPIGLLVLGMLIECFAWLGWRRSGFRAAGRWMIFLGVLSGIPTAFAGLYALADVARMGLAPDEAAGSWADVLAASPLVRADGGHAWEMATRHAWINAFTTAVLTFVVVLWVGSSDAWRRRLYWPTLLVLLAGLGGVATGAWYGGEMVYRHGVGVEEGDALVAMGAPAASADVFALQTSEEDVFAAPPASSAAAAAQQPTTTPATAPDGATAPAADTSSTSPAMPVAALGPVQPTPPDPTAPPESPDATVASATTQPTTAPLEPDSAPAPAPAPPPQMSEGEMRRMAVTATHAAQPAYTEPSTQAAAESAAGPSSTSRGRIAKPVADADSDNAAAAEQRESKGLREIERYVPPLQAHVILAGVAVALAMAALALSLRAASAVPEVQLEPRAELTDLAMAYGARPVPGAQFNRPSAYDAGPPIALADELSDVDPRERAAMDVSVVERASRIPSARFWLLTFLTAALTALAGWWVLGNDLFEDGPWDVRQLGRTVFNAWPEYPRRPLHVATGGAIVVLPLLLAMVAAWAPRRKGLVLFFSFFLVLAVAIQVWLGVLLLWDTPVGPAMGFNEPTPTTVPGVAVGD